MSTLSLEQIESIAAHIANGRVTGFLNQLLDHIEAQRVILRQREEEVERLTTELDEQARIGNEDGERLLGRVTTLSAQLVAMTGQGTPAARWQALMAALEQRFPDPRPYKSSQTPETHYLEAMDRVIAHLAAAQARIEELTMQKGQHG